MQLMGYAETMVIVLAFRPWFSCFSWQKGVVLARKGRLGRYQA